MISNLRFNYPIAMIKIIIETEYQQVLNAVIALLKGFEAFFKETEESVYDLDFVAKIEKSRQQIREGNTVKIDLDDLWK